MPSTSNAALVVDNLADLGSISSSGTASLTPPALLQNHHVARKVRFAAVTGQYAVVDLGSVKSIDTFAMFGVNLSLAGTSRIRASAFDTSGLVGEIYDSGVMTGRVDPAYGALIALAQAPVSARYIRFDLSDASLTTLEAGRMVVGRRHTFAYNYSFGAQRGRVDRSRRTESRGGQTYIDADNSYRTADISFDALTESERFGVIERLERVNGTKLDVLLILKSDSDNLGRDTIWGLVDEITPVGQPQMWINSAPGYTKTLRIKERL